jgi:hypothetical protein
MGGAAADAVEAGTAPARRRVLGPDAEPDRDVRVKPLLVTRAIAGVARAAGGLARTRTQSLRR